MVKIPLISMILILLLCILPCRADLTVISVDGDTVDTTSYLSHFTYPNSSDVFALIQQEQQRSLMNEKIPKKVIEDPISTDFTVGKVISHPSDNPAITQPIFVMGDDEFSVHWAKEHAATLKRMKAIGFIANVSSMDQLQAVEDQTDLILFPANLWDLNKIVPVRHYPFLLTNRDIEQ